MNGFALFAVVIATVCSAITGAADPVLSVDVSSTPQFNDIAGVVNKNMVLKNNNVAIASSRVAAVSDDTIKIQEADDLPPGVTLTGAEEPITESDNEMLDYINEANVGQIARIRRAMFCYRRGVNTICGWRYPINYWIRRGRFIQGGSCGFGQAYGSYYYC